MELQSQANTTTQKGILRMEIKRQVAEYIKKSPHTIMTSRWNEKTWQENCEYRNSHKQIGCIYCSPREVSCDIPKESMMFVLEMNNDSNRIMGIGLVRNRPIFNKFFVYENDRYNRFVYASKTRIDRTEMNEEEERIMKVFDILCFTGNTHLKRGKGISAFPKQMLFNMSKKMDLVEFITNMFKSRKSNTQEKGRDA